MFVHYNIAVATTKLYELNRAPLKWVGITDFLHCIQLIIGSCLAVVPAIRDGCALFVHGTGSLHTQSMAIHTQ